MEYYNCILLSVWARPVCPLLPKWIGDPGITSWASYWPISKDTGLSLVNIIASLVSIIWAWGNFGKTLKIDQN